MKARIKVTKEIVDVEPDGTMLIDTPTYISQEGKRFPVFALDFIDKKTKKDDIDWKKVRTNIAMSMIRNTDWQGFCGINFTDMIFNKANELTKKLMEDIE